MSAGSADLVRAPSQQRGRRTLQRILAATEKLLKTTPFEQITVADIVREADTSTGSFYARFPSKDALLPVVYESYNAQAETIYRDLDEAGGLKRKSLRESVRAFVAQSASSIRGMRWLLRAMTLYARAHPEGLPASAVERSKRMYRIAHGSFAPHMRDGKTARAETRSRMAAYAASTLMREYELFGDAPLAAALGVDQAAFETEVARMMAAYLASPEE